MKKLVPWVPTVLVLVNLKTSVYTYICNQDHTGELQR